MARKREIARVARARQQLRNAQRRFDRASDVDRSRLKGKALQKAFSRLVRSRQQSEVFRGKLIVAIQAPARAKRRDISKRPDRYTSVPKAVAAVTRTDKTNQKTIGKIREARFTGREGKAQRLIKKAIAEGKSAEDSFRSIAKETGLQANEVFTMFIYATIDNPNPV